MKRLPFRTFLTRRGYHLERDSFVFLRRLFVKSWAQAGFHRFWRVWNPVYGYILYHFYHFYLGLGGNRHRIRNTLLIFPACGFCFHDLLVFAISGHLGFVCTFCFLFYGAASLMCARWDRLLQFRRWPRIYNVSLNLSLCVLGLFVGALVSNGVGNWLGQTRL